MLKANPIAEPEAIAALESAGYKVKTSIGSGSFGRVYVVESSKWGDDFVCKIFHLPENSESVSEIQVLTRLCHPNIISMYDFFVRDGVGFLILEYCTGGSLQDLIDREGGLSSSKLIDYALQITSALLFCHRQNIAHRDIKPANILIDKYGRLKLADFGLAQNITSDVKTRTMVGSRAYMAPEMFKRMPTNPFLADIWALGVTFLVMAHGELPWDVYTMEDLEGGITSGMLPTVRCSNRAFAKLAKSMLQQAPEKRPPLEKVEEILKNEQKQRSPSPKPLSSRSRVPAETPPLIKESGSIQRMQCLKASPSAGNGLTLVMGKRRKSDISSLLTFPS